ncbi:MAG: hypothetical protein JXR63_11610 [Spirochaetales bacterium]|nr:hypothetical protein [Spirochaetales bacterium]
METIIIKFLFKQQPFFKSVNKETFLDFLCEMYPKINPIIERFCYSRANFETFLLSCFKYELFNYIKKRSRKFNLDKDLYFYTVNESEEIYLESKRELAYEPRFEILEESTISEDEKIDQFKTFIDKKVKNKKVFYKRLLWLTLKNISDLDAQTIDVFSYISGIDKSYIIEKANLCLESQKIAYARIKKLRERRNILFCKYLKTNKKLRKIENENQDYYREKIEKQLNRIDQLEKQISTVKLTISNRKLSEIMGVPPGTIDSGLSILKKEIENNLSDFNFILATSQN